MVVARNWKFLTANSCLFSSEVEKDVLWQESYTKEMSFDESGHQVKHYRELAESKRDEKQAEGGK